MRAERVRARTHAIALLVATAVAIPGRARAQETKTAEQTVRQTARRVGADSAAALPRLADVWNSLVEDPALLNRGLTVLGERDALRLLKNLNLRFVSFEGEGADDGAGARGLGVAYAIAHDLTRSTFRQQGASELGTALAISAAGNVAFNRRINPRDFLTTAAAFHVYGSHGGVNEMRATSSAVRTRLNALDRQMAAIATLDQLLRSPATQEFLSITQAALTTHLYWDLAATARLESDQAFRQKQYVYGAVLGGDISVPGAATLNVFDWPAAAIRWLTGSDATFSPRGSTFPSVQLELAAVDPQDDDVRALLGETGTYPRLRFETGLRTPLYTRPDGQRLFLDANYRLYQELGASASVKGADLDRFSYVAAALVSSAGPFVSYSAGRLPFDARRDDVFQLGFRFDF